MPTGLELAARLRKAQQRDLHDRLEQHLIVAEALRADAVTVHAGSLAIKEADDLLRGLACPLGGPMPGGNDLQRERFTPTTDYRRASFAGLPLLWQHGKDAEIGNQPIGRVLSSSSDSQGVWITAQLSRSFAYWRAVRQMLADAKVFLSSGADPSSVLVGADGAIKVWGVREVSLVMNPANPWARAAPVKAVPWMY